MAKEVKFSNKHGSEVIVNIHGSTVTSWKYKGEEILFCSKQAVLDGKKAIRGGIPLVFPNFGPWDLGPQHGFARIKPWKPSSPVTLDNGCVKAGFTLEDDDETRSLWNKGFKLEYTVTLGEGNLTTDLAVTNTGTDVFDFTTLLHTYFRVPDISLSSMLGLKGVTFADKVHGGDHVENRDHVTIDENYDRVYQNCTNIVKLVPDSTKPRVITLDRTNLPDVVVWNPWSDKAKGMSDFGDEEYKEMVCVEAGAVSSRVNLEPGLSMTFSQTITVSDP